jgi:hypothetical protein
MANTFSSYARLPRSYVKWIATLASLDGRILDALRLIRDRRWSYANGSPSYSHILRKLSRELGYNSSWGDPAALPAYGGAMADAAWRSLGVKNRPGVGGLPCELVHGGVGSNLGLEGSCTANALLRGLKAFLEAIVIYLPASIFVFFKVSLLTMIMINRYTLVLSFLPAPRLSFKRNMPFLPY